MEDAYSEPHIWSDSQDQKQSYFVKLQILWRKMLEILFLCGNLQFYFLFLELHTESFSNPPMGLQLSVWEKLISIPYQVDKFSPLSKLRKYDIGTSLNLDTTDLYNNNFIILCYSSILQIAFHFIISYLLDV
jgi:hypothetical protein